MAGNLDLKSLESKIRGGEIDTVLAVMVDMQGRFMGKRVTGRFFLDDVAKNGIHACAYLLTVDINMEPIPGYRLASWQSGYQDFHLVPDWDTLRQVPWLSKTAMVICDVVDEHGQPVEASPRQILKKQIERAKKAGFVVKTASELEFYLFKDSYESARAKNFHHLEPSGAYIEDYHILQTSKDEPFIQAVRNGMEGAGVPVESSKGEWGPGQQEINLSFAEALEMADRHSIYKNGLKEIAAQNNLAATFMAKYDDQKAGSSCHVHSSFWDLKGEKSAFFDAAKPGGLSDLFRHYLAGQLSLAREFSFFFAPTGNSYKRYQAGTFAPTRVVWGRDNRTCGLRVIGEGNSLRLENRLPGADANVYLAFAATIAAGLKGIADKKAPPEEFSGDAYAREDLPKVPGTLPEAIAALEKSQAAREAFGAEVVDHYLHAARTEAAAYDKAVTCWELERYFERI
jgi:glutamine synthetase